MFENLTLEDLTLVGAVVFLFHWTGLVSAFHALLKCRTSQAAIAWSFPLVMFPYLTLPLYWIFGRAKYYGYVTARRQGDLEINHIAAELNKHAPEFGVRLEEQETPWSH